jgi:hypothetical protein
MFKTLKIDEGMEHYIGIAPTLEAARVQIFALSEWWPAEYAILDLDTGHRTSFPKPQLQNPAGCGTVVDLSFR